MTKQEVIKLLVLIEYVYSTVIIKDELVLRWFDFCSHMDYQKVMEKLLRHIRKSPYPPTMADIAVFKENEYEFPVKIKTWIVESCESEYQRPLFTWTVEYSPRNLNV